MTESTDSINDSVLDVDGLEQNRAGRLTSDQERRWLALRGGLAFGMYFWAAWLLAMIWAVTSLISRSGSPGAYFLMGIAGIGSLLVLGTKRWLDVGHDVRGGRVAEVSGAIHKSRIPLRSGRESLFSFVSAGNRRFQCDSFAWWYLPASGAGRLYYLPRSRRVVNFEPLSKSDIREH